MDVAKWPSLLLKQLFGIAYHSPEMLMLCFSRSRRMWHTLAYAVMPRTDALQNKHSTHRHCMSQVRGGPWRPGDQCDDTRRHHLPPL
jgi:hypothetical protein